MMTHVAVAIIRKNGKILACQRKRGGRYELKWEFPGGKIEEGESAAQCLERELQEELEIHAPIIEQAEVSTAHYDDGGLFKVTYCHISHFTGEPQNKVFEQIRWVTPLELQELDILDGNRTIVARIAADSA